MIRQTRSCTRPTRTFSKPNSSRQNGTRSTGKTSKTVPRQCKHFTPIFTWDIDKTDKKVIYDDLGVKEIDIVGGAPADRSYTQKNKKRQLHPSNCGITCTTGVEGRQVSPCQVKALKEHIHDGHICSCKKQLLLDNSNDPFCTLSDEIMLGIFHLLPKLNLARCARVCKRWNYLVIDDSLWRRIDLSNKIFVAGTLGRVLQRGTTAAKLSRCSIQGSVFDKVIPQSTPAIKETRTTTRASNRSKNPTMKATIKPTIKPVLHLQYLDLSASDSTPEQLAEILDHCPNNQLKKLSLESCAVNDDMATSISNQGGSLEELNLCMCTGLKEAGLRLMLESCAKLKALNIAWASLSRKELSALIECAPRSLEKLNLSGCRQMLRNEDVILLASSRCPAIKELDLSDATTIGFIAIEAIVDHMTELQHIALSRCYSIPRLSFAHLGSLNNLHALDIFGLIQEDGVMQELLPSVQINKYPFSAIARPTTTKKRSNIWEITCSE